jgi:hypothetical protein
MQNLDELSTPEEFIKHYYDQLKIDLNSVDLQISKVGLIGYILNLMGNLQYDIKQYYNYLFNEAFPISAIDNANLIEHSTLFGFNYDLAVPATLNGSINFNLDALLSPTINVIKREIHINSASFILNSMQYVMDSKYVIIMVKTNSIMNWFVQVTNINGEKTNFPITYTNAYASIIDFNQYKQFDEIFSVPLYKFNSFYPIKIKVPNDQDICSISVRIQEINNDYEQDFEIRNIKNFSESNDNHVFYRIYENEQGKILLIELGSGVHGKYIPRSTVTISVKTTYGEKGNIGIHNIKKEITNDITIFDYYSTTDVNEIRLTSRDFINLQIVNGSGGKNILKQEKLRTSLIEYIQNRDNLISETDYRQIIGKVFEYYTVMFKKSTLHENIIYIYIDILDKYLKPIYTNTKAISYIDFVSEPNIEYIIRNSYDILETYIINPIFDDNGKQLICPFIFKKNPNISSFSALLLKHNYSQYYTSIIENDVSRLLATVVGSSLHRTFTYTKVLPLIYLEIKLEFEDVGETESICRTIFSVKSTSDISGYGFKLTIANLNISEEEMIFEEGSNISANYIHYGLTSDIFTATINIFDDVSYTTEDAPVTIKNMVLNILDLKFEGVQYLLDLEDIFRLKTIIYRNENSELEHLLINVPLIDNDQFNSNKDYIINTLYTRLKSLDISNIRMVTDDPQLRFLNSNYITSDYLKILCPLGPQYDFNLYLPLKVFINLTFIKSYVLINKIDIVVEVENIKYEISKFLNSEKTGPNFYFYKSTIDDIIHNFPSVKGADVFITDKTGYRDSNNNILGQYIPNGNLIVSSQDDLIDRMTKDQILKYCPTLFWWDINNISIYYITD